MTPEELKAAVFRGPIRFIDGRRGMAQQDFECVANPRFGYSWRREDRTDKGRQFYTVDGGEVADLEEAARLLAAPPPADSPAEQRRRAIDEFEASPKLNYGATRALSEAQCNVSVGPFGTVRAWMQRAGDSWHRGINLYAEWQRQGGVKFEDYRWLYAARHAAWEVWRLIYSFEADRKSETNLRCALDVRCRECPILGAIDTAMKQEQAAQRPFPREISDSDIDAAKAWTCISHVLHARGNPVDGVFVVNDRDRQAAADEAAAWASMADDDPGEAS